MQLKLEFYDFMTGFTGMEGEFIVTVVFSPLVVTVRLLDNRSFQALPPGPH